MRPRISTEPRKPGARGPSRSSGPHTTAGKARSARNSRKHGLTLGVLTPQALSVNFANPFFGTFSAGIAAVAEECDLVELLARPYGGLSAGQRTRVSLAKALLNEPDVLLLDEPTASLDPDTADWVRSWLERYRAARNATVLLASHNMGEVERLCDRVIMMKQGKIVDDDTPGNLISRYGRSNLEEVFLDIARGLTDERVPGGTVEVKVAAKGGGSENKSKFVMLNPSDSVVDWVLAQFPGMGAGWCPPGVIGIGIGGSPEQAMLLAKLRGGVEARRRRADARSRPDHRRSGRNSNALPSISDSRQTVPGRTAAG